MWEEVVDKNQLIYQGVLHLYNAAMCFEDIDNELSKYLLFKCKTHLEDIVIDSKAIKEIDEYVKEIKL